MITRFAIEPCALSDQPNDVAEVHAQDKRVFERWKLYGVLYINNACKEWTKAIEALPITRRKMWKTALSSHYYRKVFIDHPDIPECISDKAKIDSLAHCVDVAGLEKTRAFYFGLPSTEISTHTTKGLEICRLENIDQSSSFSQIVDAWSGNVKKGAKSDEVWSGRLSGLATYASTISIVDRYCVGNAAKATDKQTNSALAEIMKRIGSSKGPRKKSVNIYSSLAEVNLARAKAELDKISQAYQMPEIASIHLYMVDEKTFGRAAHDRFIRFGQTVVSIGKGVDLFGAKICGQITACSISCDDKQEFELHTEGILRKSSSTYQVR